MSDTVQAALKEAERVCKKQKVCASKTLDVIDALLASAQSARQALAADAGKGAKSGAESLANLYQQLTKLDVAAQASSHTKELHSAVSKLGKALDKTFEADVCKAMRELEFDRATLNTVIAKHLYQEGRFDVGDAFVEEAGVEGGQGLKAPFVDMHGVLQQIRAHNLGPAASWIDSHRQQLADVGVLDGFEFRLHRLQYLHVLTTRGQEAALEYARKHFGAFRSTQLHEIQRLMGCLAFFKRPVQASPYADLMRAERWDEYAQEFSRHCCALIGLPSCSPLLVTVSAGAAALPTLLKLATVMTGQIHDMKTCDQLPVELELGHEFVFNSIFACPVSREQSTSDNPPMMLPCGHVLCKQSVVKIAKNSTRSFKCPYCPVEATLNSCKQLKFTDAPEA